MTVSTIDILKQQIYGQDAPSTDLPQLKEVLASRLRHGVWVVSFTKVDGTPSVMECTLDSRHIPQVNEAQNDKSRPGNPTVLRVYAIDRGGWRSFKVANVTSIYMKPEIL